MTESMAMLEDAATARLALSPLRLRLLARLREPASAAALGEELGLPRQKIGYHLRKLEEAGLIRGVGTRKRRGFTERLMETCSGALLVDPMILAGADPEAVEKQDRFAAEHLVRTAAEMVRDVSRMREAAAAEGSRLLTFTVEADVTFAAPGDVARFVDRLSGSLKSIAEEFAPKRGDGRAYRVTIAGHPAVGSRLGRSRKAAH